MKHPKKSPLLCVFAHPDDEAFGPGGSIAKFATEREVHLLCVTTVPGQLGEVRRKELETSAKILGVSSVEFLNFDDGGLSNGIYQNVVTEIQRVVNMLEPDTLLTFEPHGVSGHIDHIAVSMMTTYVFYHSDLPQTLMYFCETKEVQTAFCEKDYFVYMPPGYDTSEIHITIDISKFSEIRIKAMKAHVSQKSDADYILTINARFPKEEHFLVLKK